MQPYGRYAAVEFHGHPSYIAQKPVRQFQPKRHLGIRGNRCWKSKAQRPEVELIRKPVAFVQTWLSRAVSFS